MFEEEVRVPFVARHAPPLDVTKEKQLVICTFVPPLANILY